MVNYVILDNLVCQICKGIMIFEYCIIVVYASLAFFCVIYVLLPVSGE